MLKRCIQLDFFSYATFKRDMGKILQKIGYFGQFFKSRILRDLENFVFGSLIRYMLQRCIQLVFFSSAILEEIWTKYCQKSAILVDISIRGLLKNILFDS